MQCPRDGAELQEVKVHDLVTDRCPVCSGVWFDFAMLERIFSYDSRALKPLMPEMAPRRLPDEEYMDCPRCDDVLIRMRSSEEAVEYYGCLTCYGRWVDGNRMERLAGRSLMAKYQRLFEQLLH